jgi:hypothetical protein
MTVQMDVPAVVGMMMMTAVRPMHAMMMTAVRHVGAVHAVTAATADAVMTTTAAAMRARISNGSSERRNADNGRRDEGEESRTFEHGR